MLRWLLFAAAILPPLAASIAPTEVQADVRLLRESEAKTKTMHDFPRVEVFGTITPDDVKKLPSLLNALKPGKHGAITHANGKILPIVFFSSPGGNLSAALKIGQTLREASAWTIVDHGKECSSACVLAFAGGVNRAVLNGAKIGLHRPYYAPGSVYEETFAKMSPEDAQASYKVVVETSRSYLQSMNIPEKILDDMLRVPGRSVRYVDSSYAEQVGLSGEDPGYSEWSHSARVRAMGAEQARRLDTYIDCLNGGEQHAHCERSAGYR